MGKKSSCKGEYSLFLQKGDEWNDVVLCLSIDYFIYNKAVNSEMVEETRVPGENLRYFLALGCSVSGI